MQATLFAEPEVKKKIIIPPEPKLTLYPHQEVAEEDVREAFRKGHRQVILQCPTGFGKSEIASDMLSKAADKGLAGLFVVHRRTLVEQFSGRLTKYGVKHGMMMAGKKGDREALIQVASIDTLHSRFFGDKALPLDLLPDWRLIVYDEAHTHPDRARMLMEKFPNAYVIGLTATPAPTDGLGMKRFGYTKIVHGPTVRWLMDNGYLVDAKYFSVGDYNYDNVKVNTKTGEYVESSADEVVDKPELIGDVIANYGVHGQNLPFVVFANSVKHSRHIADMFCEAGISCKHIDCNTKQDEREEAFKGVRSGAIRGLSNYGILDRGFDLAEISVCILARKVRNITTVRQMLGRVLRTCPGKEYAIVIDHGGNITKHGFADDEIEWTLDPTTNINDKCRDDFDNQPPEKKPITCPNCKTSYRGQRKCPNCGCEPAVPKGEVEHTDDILVEIKREQKPLVSPEEKDRWRSELLGYAKEKGHEYGWVYHKYKAKFKEDPPRDRWINPQPPSDEVRKFITSQNIRYARGKAKWKR